MNIDKLKNKFSTGAFVADVKHYFSKINEIIDYLNGNSGEGSYKVYTALLTQSGTNAPVATVLENTLGAITLIRGGVGQYILQSSGLFTMNKTVLFVGLPDYNISQFIINTDQLNTDDSNIDLECIDASTLNGLDGALKNTPIEIRVYN